MKILITGAAGFIGYHLSKRLLDHNHRVTGIDNLNAYYDVQLKQARKARLEAYENFEFFCQDIADKDGLNRIFSQRDFEVVVHLAAQAGVRYSLINPDPYIQTNLVGFLPILENCRHHRIKHLLFASSSSVYGANEKQPFSESDPVDHPLSLYAASKKANELMAHSYASLYNLPCTGLRFFTVYGPWGRPDMALFKFTRAILEGNPIEVYNHGKMIRDFTYIDDLIDGLLPLLTHPATPDPHWSGVQPNPARSYAPYRLYNIGSSHPVHLDQLITALEHSLGKPALRLNKPFQPGDVPSTFADTTQLKNEFGYQPKHSLQEGVQAFVDWYKTYYS